MCKTVLGCWVYKKLKSVWIVELWEVGGSLMVGG